MNRQTLGAWIEIVILGIISIFANPFSYDNPHNRRYLLPVFQTADPELFPGDPVVDSIRGFRSVYYDVLEAVVIVANLKPEEFETFMRVLWAGAAFLLMASLRWVAGGFREGRLTFWLLGLWACHPMRSTLGGDTLFIPTLTHREVAAGLGFLAIGLALRGRSLALIVLGLVVFIHSLIAVHLAAVLAPVLLLRRFRDEKDRKAGLRFMLASLAFFLACLGFYLFGMAPRLNAEELELFFQSKSQMNHISLDGQEPYGWWLMTGLVVLALSASRLWLTPSDFSRRAQWALLISVAPGVVIAFAGEIFESARLAQIQPMRIFLWTTFLASLLIAASAAELLKRLPPLSAVLTGYIAFNLIGSVLKLPCFATGFIAFFPFANSSLWRIDAPWRIIAARAGILGMAAINGFVFTLGRPNSLESLHDSVTVWCPLTLILLAYCPKCRPRFAIGATLVFLALWITILSSLERKRIDRDFDPDWRQVTQWCRGHTPKQARFLTPVDHVSFRFHALRTPVSETIPALVWVDPLLHQKLSLRFEEVKQVRGESKNSWDGLRRLAHEWGATYVIVDFDPRSNFNPVFQAGKYRVYSTEE